MNTGQLIAWIAIAAGALYVATKKTTPTNTPIQPSSSPTPDPTLQAYNPGLYDLATAISIAEGFPVTGSIPQRANNPGDLVRGDVGFGTLGSQNVTVYGSVQDGWSALWFELSLIQLGQSDYYTPGETFAAMARTYTGSAGVDWANNVVSSLRSKGYSVTVDSTIDTVLNA